ncbi:substrate-binding domain-containing protein [Kribbella sp. NPDC005582]|uniref:LacI family DNA-binding transcriptional regulator n=1 Tax=Kribbella sp. NPDC005582 TaxID=3156893 RepID=UPI00339F5F79
MSRVLNDNPNVSRTTRAKVEAAMKELGYRPNSTARALTTGKTGVLGVVVFDTFHYGPAKVLEGIGQVARDADYAISVMPVRSADRRSVRQAVDRLLLHAVDGLITIAPEEAMARALLDLPHRIPRVAVDASFDSEVPVAAADERGGASHATEHLLQLGHRTVWHIAGPDGSFAARERCAGWREALERVGADVPQPLVGDWEAESGYLLGRELAARADVTAVFAANDFMALGLLRALREAGRRVPEDVSVIGVDDIPEAAYLIPPLSTVRPDFVEAGRRCLELLLEQMASGRNQSLHSVIPTQLIIRRTSAAAPH